MLPIPAVGKAGEADLLETSELSAAGLVRDALDLDGLLLVPADDEGDPRVAAEVLGGTMGERGNGGGNGDAGNGDGGTVTDIGAGLVTDIVGGR